MATKRKSSERSQRRSQSKKESPGGMDLLVLELQEIYSAESQLARAAPRFLKAVESERLQQMLEQRMEQGAQLIEDLDNAFEEMEQSPGRKKNVAAEGLINDLREHMQEIAEGPALDSVLIAGIQKLEHYCIAAWGTSRSLAQAAGVEAVVKSMERALKQGKQLDEQLTQLAEQDITPALMAEEDADEASDEEQDEESDSEDEEAQPKRRSRARSGSERTAH
jgi:ferritin-like metal-binding protein YciE